MILSPFFSEVLLAGKEKKDTPGTLTMRIIFKNDTELAMSMVLEKEVNTEGNTNSEREEMVIYWKKKTATTFWKSTDDIKGIGEGADLNQIG